MEILKNFYNNIESITHHGYMDNEEERFEARIVIGKTPVKSINIKNILRGIANCEMGFDPIVHQNIYFLDTLSWKGFRMYDDRGCFVWSNSAENIRDIYTKLNSWIVDYHRPEIDPFFK